MLPKYDAVCHCLEQSFRFWVDRQDVLTFRILLQGRVDVVGKGKSLLLYNTVESNIRSLSVQIVLA